MLRLVFRQTLRQTEGLMGSIFQLLGGDLQAPDHTTVSRRSMTLKIDVIIPPLITAQPGAQFEAAPTVRDNHLQMIQSLGRLEWQQAYCYGKCALGETTVVSFKAIIGPKLRARDARGQRAEANVAVAVLNRMLNAGRPNSVRTSAVTAKHALGLG
jgi:hypothetical protein